jgi:hypothetical protein
MPQLGKTEVTWQKNFFEFKGMLKFFLMHYVAQEF